MKFFPVFILAILLISTVSAVTITDTTFFSTGSNYTIFVDMMELDNVTVTAGSINFHDVTSLGTNLTNTNATFDAVASFFGLNLNFTLFNVNTSTNIFTSSPGAQDFNITFTPGEIIRIVIADIDRKSTFATCNQLLPGFGTFFSFFPIFFTILAIIIIVFMLIGLMFVVRDQSRPNPLNIDLSSSGLISAVSALGLLGFIGLIFLIILAFLCTV